MGVRPSLRVTRKCASKVRCAISRHQPLACPCAEDGSVVGAMVYLPPFLPGGEQ